MVHQWRPAASPPMCRIPRYAGLYGPAIQHEDCDGTKVGTPALDSQPYPSAEYMEDWLARMVELIDLYQPQLIWFDWWIEQKALEPYLKQFAAYYYNRAAQWGKGVVMNYKYEAFPHGTAGVRHRARPARRYLARCFLAKRHVGGQELLELCRGRLRRRAASHEVTVDPSQPGRVFFCSYRKQCDSSDPANEGDSTCQKGMENPAPACARKPLCR